MDYPLQNDGVAAGQGAPGKPGGGTQPAPRTDDVSSIKASAPPGDSLRLRERPASALDMARALWP